MADVQLSGYEGPRGFRPVQVYDRSRQLQQAAQQEKEYRDRSFSDYKNKIQQFGNDIAKQASDNLDALSGFSNTLSQFLTDYQEKENDKQYKLGLAEVMNGNVQLPQSAFDKHHTEVEGLRVAAESDGEVANEITNAGDFEFGTDFRQTSKAVRGWRAYGQAVGSAKKAALGSQGFLQEFWNRTDAIVRIGDGYKSPAQIANEGNKAEVAAALSLAQNEYFQVNKLYNLNPIVLAEHFAPTWQAVRAQSTANTMSSIAANTQETAVYESTNAMKTEVGSIDFRAPDASAKLGESFQQQVQNLVIKGNVSRGKANETILQTTLESIKLMDADEAELALDALAKATKVSSMGDKGTFGALHGDQIEAARREVRQLDRARRSEIEADKNLRAEQLYLELNDLRNKATDPAVLAQETKRIQAELQQIGGTRAATIIASIRSDANKPKDYVIFNNALAALDGDGLTLEQINALETTEANKEILRSRALDRERTGFKSEYGGEIDKQAAAELQNAAADSALVTLDPVSGRPREDPLVFENFRDEVEERLFSWIEKQKAQGQDPSKQDIRDETARIVKDVFPTYYTNQGKARANVKPEGFDYTTSPATGEKLNDLRGVKKLDTVRFNGAWSGFDNSLVLSQQELQNEVALYNAGKPMGNRAAAYLGGNTDARLAFLRSQEKHYGLPSQLADSPQAQSEASVRRMSPFAARNYYRSGSSIRQENAAYDIARTRALEQRREYNRAVTAGEIAPKVGRSGKPITPDVQLFALAKAQGMDDELAIKMVAISLAESSGDSGAYNGKGNDRSYGLWQINMINVPGFALGEERDRDLGLGGDYDRLYDPEENARAMYYVYNRQGLNAWSVYDNGRGEVYRGYLPDARAARNAYYAQQQQ
jgi:hypothetical protein